jgi:CRISPR/Cas system-associated exonuclease Cas4 (RecB family)
MIAMKNSRALMSNLPSDFHFSQSSLQDYTDCPRRFQLRYLLNLAWPAVEAEPVQENEQRMLMGGIFHQLIHQHLLGLPQERLTQIAADEHLARWWRNYLNHAADLSSLLNLAGSQATTDLQLHPEVLLSAPLGNYRLVAKYDLIAIQPGVRIFIIDWKTTRKPPSRQWLEQRLQTLVYPYLLVEAGTHLNTGTPIRPEQVEMIYWFAEQPDEIRRFAYHQKKYQEDGRYLASLVSEIESLGDADFALTSDRRRCSYCKYRSYCDRGVHAGTLDEMEDGLEVIDEGEVAIDFEHIAEIEF